MYSDDIIFLGDMLVRDGIISKDQLKIALKLQEPARVSGGELVGMGVISPCEFRLYLEVLLADIIMGLGYADEREIYGSSKPFSTDNLGEFQGKN